MAAVGLGLLDLARSLADLELPMWLIRLVAGAPWYGPVSRAEARGRRFKARSLEQPVLDHRYPPG
jgi:hypothetical protein